jgi:uncharacterized protein (TIRG00374 family)
MFAAIVYGIGPSSIVTVLRSVDPARLAIAPVLIAAILLLRGVRWLYLMRRIGIDYTLSRSVVVWTIGFFASAVTPAKVGDAVRAVYVHNETDATFGESLLTVFIDRLWDLMTVLAAGIVTLFLFSHYYIEIPSIWIVVTAVVVVFAVLYMLLSKGLMRRVVKPLFDLIVPEKYKLRFSINFHSFYDSLHVYRQGGRAMAVVAALTLCYWTLVFLLAFYVTWLLRIDVGLRMPIVTLVELLPISVSGLGTRDATVIYFFSLVGAASAQAVGFSIAYVLIGTYLTSLVGFVLWLRNPVALGGDN